MANLDSAGTMMAVRFLALGVVAVLVSTSVFPSALWAEPRRSVIIASGSVDGAYYPIAGAISRITSDARDLNFLVAVESSAGSIANVQLLKSGEADFALLQNDVAYYAFNGITLDAFAGKPVKNMTGVFSVYPEIVHVIARRSADVRSIRDLKGKRVVLGAPGSGAEQNALQVLKAHGIRETDLRTMQSIARTAALDQLKAGIVDAVFVSTALGSPLIADAMASGKLTLVGIGDAGDALRRSYPFYTIEKIPANTYPGQEHDVTSAGVMAILVARSSVSEELVYSLTKAVFDNLLQFQSSHPAARHLTLHTALSGMALPLHPGSERYFQQNGIAR
jgi:TRAP transporter TAXI family solute receptor